MARRRRYDPRKHPRDKNGRFARKGTGKVLKSRGLTYRARRKKTGAINRGLTSADKSRGRNSLKAKINRKPSGRAKWAKLANGAAKVGVGVGVVAALAISGLTRDYIKTTANGDKRHKHNAPNSYDKYISTISDPLFQKEVATRVAKRNMNKARQAAKVRTSKRGSSGVARTFVAGASGITIRKEYVL